MTLIIDNYDSFTYNLYQAVGAINPDVRVVKNDELTLSEIAELAPERIIISPGPGRPSDSGVSLDVIRKLGTGQNIPILGVCLGHQVICEAFGATVSYASELVHGKKRVIHVANGSPIFAGLPPVIEGGRYHSLAARRDTIPDELLVIAEDDNGEVMAVKHRDYEIYGVQFHPESILTPQGTQIIENFLKIGGDAL